MVRCHLGRIRFGLLSMVMCMALVACGQSATGNDSTQPTLPPVKTVSGNTVAAEGEIVPYQQAHLSFKTMGRIEQILVQEGEKVIAGQELAKLDARDLEQAVLQAQAQLASAQAELTQAKTGARPEEIDSAEAVLRIAETEAQTAEIAIQVSEGNLDAAEAVLQESKVGVQTAQDDAAVIEGNLSSALASLETAKANLAKLQAGPTALEIQIAEKRIELARNRLWGLQGQRDALGQSGTSPEYEAAQGEVAAAQSEVEIATLELDQLKAGTKPEDIAISQAQVAEAASNVQIVRAQLSKAQTGIEGARAQEAEAEAHVATAQAQLESSKTQYQRALANVAKAQAENALLKAGPREEEVAVAQANVAIAQSALTAAQNALEDAVLRAPFDGTIGLIQSVEGELVAAQMEVIRLGDLSRIAVETKDLSEVDVTRVQTGQDATITVDALSNKEFTGVVSSIALVATDYRGDKVYTALLDLASEPDSGLRWGMTVFVEIDVR